MNVPGITPAMEEPEALEVTPAVEEPEALEVAPAVEETEALDIIPAAIIKYYGSVSGKTRQTRSGEAELDDGSESTCVSM